MNTSPDELNQLISAVLDGQLSEPEQERLRTLLRESPEAQQRYLELAHVDSLLQWNQGELSLLPEPPVAPELQSVETGHSGSRYRRQVQRLRWMLATTLLACCLLTGLLFFRFGQSEAIARNKEPLPESGPVAIISQAENVKWGSTELMNSLEATVGKPLTTGWIKLEEGRVQLDFYGGATLVLEGPVELGITARNRAHLKSGKLTFFSGDQPGGFYLSSDAAKLFGEKASGGVIVTDDKLEVHTLKGELRLFDAPNAFEPHESVVIEEGTGLVLAEDATAVEEVSFDRWQFVPEHELELEEQPGTSVPFDFTAQPMGSYGFQDGQHDLPAEAELRDEGERLVLRGNTWKLFEVNQQMTDDLVIEFEFRSGSEGQIHGFGFDSDDTYNDRASVMQIHGYEALPTIGQQYNTYRGEEWQTFRIPVGRYFSGFQKYLYFVADDDVIGRAESEFRNVRFFRRAGKRVQ